MNWKWILISAALLAGAAADAAEDVYTRPVPTVASTFLDVPSYDGTAALPLYVSADWTAPQPDITRAVIVIHGLRRNADSYFDGAKKAQASAGALGAHTIMVSPQFLADFDVAGHPELPSNTLGWQWDRWARGAPALRPAPISSFTALDAVVARLADPKLFPNLDTIVVAGFSAGGQVVQRYAVVGEADKHARDGIGIQYVVSDPSSYLYFSAERPRPDVVATCPGFNNWHYGFAADMPPYVGDTIAAYEARYIRRHVTYLLGMADTDPNHPVLDKSCAGEAEGPQRFARGHAYWDYLRARYGEELRQTLIDVPDIAHEGNRMFTSECGLHVLFGLSGCGE